MALINCPECQHRVSDKATSCPECGHPIKEMPVEEKNKISCPSCKSTNVHVDKRGYDAGEGCCGYLMCGPLGFLYGQKEANKIIQTCLSCGHKWELAEQGTGQQKYEDGGPGI